MSGCWLRLFVPIAAVIVALPTVTAAEPAAAAVTTQRVPDGGIQPQAAVDARGNVHVIYFRGDPAKGDVFYVRSADGGATFSPPIRVNSEDGSAIAIGTIRGPRLAV